MMKKKLNKISEVKMEKILEDDRYLIHIIRKNWKKMVGEMIAEYSFPSFFSNGKLTVIVGNNLILNEVRMLQETVLENINEALYDNRVKDIYLKTGNLYDKKDNLYRDFEDEFFDPSEIKITEEEKEKIEEEFSKYGNSQITERIKKIAMNAKETEKILVRKGYKECIRCYDLFMGAGEICIKCKNELAEERLKGIKRILERNPLISYRDISKETEITESEYYHARDQLAEELAYIISDFIEEKNIIAAKETARRYAIYKVGSDDEYIISQTTEKLINRLTKFLKIRGKI